MATITTTYLGDLRTEAKHTLSRTKIVTDAPADNNGKGEEFSPVDLVATALTSCMLTMIGSVSKIHGFNIDGTMVETKVVMCESPRRIGEIIVKLNFIDTYDDYTQQIIKAAAKGCPVTNSLHPEIKQSILFNWKK